MKKAISIMALILVLCCSLTACGGKGENLVGTWTVTDDGVEMSFVFNSDGTGKITALAGLMSVQYTYEVDGDTITFHELNEEVLGTTPYTFSIKGDKLSLTAGGDTIVLTKEK